jgi:hypothetical protein
MALIATQTFAAFAMSAVAQQSPISVRVNSVQPPTWLTADSKQTKTPKPGDRCLNMSLETERVLLEEWCNATFVTAEVSNNTYFKLRFVVICTAYNDSGQPLGSGRSDQPSPERNEPPAHSILDEIDPHYQQTTLVRLYKVKYADVARVECRPYGIAKVGG